MMRMKTAGQSLNERQLTAGVILLIVVLATAYYMPWISGSRAFYQSDTSYFFEPFCHYIADRFRSGQLPLWNPFIWCGISQVASLSPSIFYPFNLLFVPLKFSPALALYVLFHEFIAFGGMFILCRKLGLSKLAALCAAVVAGFNGYMISIVTNFTLMATAAWMPMAVAAIYSVSAEFDRRNVRWLAIGTASVAMMITAGRAELFAPALGILSFYAAVACIMRWRAGERQAAVKQLLWRAGTMALGICVAAPLLLAALEWWRISSRAFGMRANVVLLWSANWYDWLSTIFIQPLGDLTDITAKQRELVTSYSGGLPYVPSSYIGPVPMTLAAVAIFSRGWRGRWWFFGIGLLMALLASGINTPIAPYLVTHFPFMSFFRFPIKLMIIPLFCIAVLAGAGLDAICEKRVHQYVVMAVTAVWLAFAGIGFYLRFAPDVIPALASIPMPADFTPFMERLAEAQALLGRSILSGSLIAISVGVLCIMYLIDKVPRQIFAAVIAFAIAWNIALAAFLYPPHSTRGDFYEMPNPLATELKPHLFDVHGFAVQRAVPLYTETAYIPHGAGVPNADENCYRQERLMLYGNQAIDFGIPTSIGFEATENGRLTRLNNSLQTLMWRIHNPTAGNHTMSDSDILLARFCKITGSGFVSMPLTLDNPPLNVVPLDQRWFKLIGDNSINNFAIYRCRESNNRWYFARNIIPTIDWTNFYRWLQDINDPSFDKVFVGTDRVPAPDALPASPADANEQAVLEADQPEYVRMKTTTTNKRLLVLTDPHYPRFNAYLDGKPVYTYRANLFFRAVAVPAGTHTIEFKYEPTSAYVGMAIALLSALGIGLLWMRSRRVS
jgi:hypothetical protein